MLELTNHDDDDDDLIRSVDGVTDVGGMSRLV